MILDPVMKKKIFFVIIVLLILAQFKRIDKTNPPAVKEQDFFTLHEAKDETRALIKAACYDCHSHHTEYPWYSNISPVSWWLKNHIDHGREHLNFSTWSALPPEDEPHLFKKIEEVLTKKEMPMLPYMMAHNEAWIDEEQRASLAQFFHSLQ